MIFNSLLKALSISILFVNFATAQNPQAEENLSFSDFIKKARRAYSQARRQRKNRKSQSKRNSALIRPEGFNIGVEEKLNQDSGVCVGCKEVMPLTKNVLSILDKLQKAMPNQSIPISEEISSLKAHYYITRKISELSNLNLKNKNCPLGLDLLNNNSKGAYSKNKTILFSSSIPLKELNQLQINRENSGHQLYVMRTNIKDKFIIVEVVEGHEPTISLVQMEYFSWEEPKTDAAITREIIKKREYKTWGPKTETTFGINNKIRLGFEIDYKESSINIPKELRIFSMETKTDTPLFDIKTKTVLSTRDQEANIQLTSADGDNIIAEFTAEIDGDLKLGIPMEFSISDNYGLKSKVSVMNKGAVEGSFDFIGNGKQYFSLKIQNNKDRRKITINKEIQLNDSDRISFQMSKSSDDKETGAWLRFERRF
ncbi:MAG: hypothetical protein HN576_00330 [Bacteriovoracaceae bacterium]|jgi:hypothetical protein|nr:hypothetical protein [Bacteriovoracaceae bacterium]